VVFAANSTSTLVTVKCIILSMLLVRTSMEYEIWTEKNWHLADLLKVEAPWKICNI